jgi:hypothetical protein
MQNRQRIISFETSSSYGCLAYFLAIVFPSWAFEITLFHMVGLLTLFPTPNLEDWDYTLGFAFPVALAHA